MVFHRLNAVHVTALNCKGFLTGKPASQIPDVCCCEIQPNMEITGRDL